MGFYPSTVQCEFPKFSIYFGVRSSLLYLVRENSSQHSDSYVMLIFWQKIPFIIPLFDPSRLLILAIHLSVHQIIFNYVY